MADVMWEPGYREVPATDPPDYQPDEDFEPWHPSETTQCRFGVHLTCPAPAACDCECHQDEAEQAWETYYQPTEGDRGGPDA